MLTLFLFVVSIINFCCARVASERGKLHRYSNKERIQIRIYPLKSKLRCKAELESLKVETGTLFFDKGQIGRGFITRSNVQLFKDTMNVIFYRADFNDQVLSDLLVREAFSDQF